MQIFFYKQLSNFGSSKFCTKLILFVRFSIHHIWKRTNCWQSFQGWIELLKFWR